MIEIVSDSYLRIKNLPADWEEALSNLVSIENEKKSVAIKEHIWGAYDMPDRITPAQKIGDYFILPRGFKGQLLERLQRHNVEYTFTDKEISNKNIIEYKSNITLRPLQDIAKKSIIDNSQGLIMASPGFGKTTVSLDTICELQQFSIVLVDKSDLAKQWIKRGAEQFNLDIGLIGDGEFNIKPVTVAIMQTLRSRQDELDRDNFWFLWGCVFYDEQHHSSSETYYEIVNKFPAKFRIGISATKGKSDSKEKLSELIFGQVIFEDKTNNLKPSIQRIKTNFKFDYKPTKKIGRKVIKNNYQDLLNSLIEDDNRNNQIAKKISSEQECAHLIVSRRLQHLENIKNESINLGFPPEKCFMLTGKQSSDERLEIAELADKGNIAIFSTVADEGLDIPRLDRIHLVFPSKNHETIRQQVGRGLRNHENKTETIVYDYVDMSIGVIRNQWRNRMIKYYKENDFPIECYDY
jgi:superfamily II DNA or RNA helicase